MYTFTLGTKNRQECIDITSKLTEIIVKYEINEGICYIFVPHATAAIIINENADPNIQKDFMETLNRLIPKNFKYLHNKIDDNAQSHLIASCLGPSETVPISNGKLQLGRWQSIMFVELDGPRPSRKVHVQLVKA